MKAKNSLDDVNRYIISEMIKDGRVKYTKLARDLGVTPAAVKERIDRLIKNKLIKPTILINIQEFYPVGAAIGVEGDQDTIESLIKRLSSMPNVLRVARASGNHNLILSIVAEDFVRLEAFINNNIRSESGIKHVEVNITHSAAPFPDFAYLKLVGEKVPMLEKIKKKAKG